jgi:hypothetical protein
MLALTWLWPHDPRRAPTEPQKSTRRNFWVPKYNVGLYLEIQHANGPLLKLFGMRGCSSKWTLRILRSIAKIDPDLFGN